MATVVGNGTESAYRIPCTRLRRAPARARAHGRALSGNRIMLIRILRRAVEIRSRASASLADRLAGTTGRRPGFACEPSLVDTIRAGCSYPPGFLVSRSRGARRSLANCCSSLSIYLSLDGATRFDGNARYGRRTSVYYEYEYCLATNWMPADVEYLYTHVSRVKCTREKERLR